MVFLKKNNLFYFFNAIKIKFLYCIVLKAYKFRLTPNNEQKTLLNKHIGACRFIYNLALETKTLAYSSAAKNLNRYDLQLQLKDLKEDCGWLKEINSQSLQTELMHLDAAYLKFFKGAGFPKFKKKSGKQSFQCPQNVSIENNKIWLPKFKTGINIIQHREFFGELKTVTITKTPTDKYYASILVDDNKELPKKLIVSKESSVGIDLGIKTFAVTSDKKEYENPKYLKKQLERIKSLQKKLKRTRKDSINRKKKIKIIAKKHEKIANQRKDFLHKVSNEITNQYNTLFFENLNVKGMVKNHKLAQSISDASWGNFTKYTKYKCDWKGKNFFEIGRFEPSSKIHNNCGYFNKELNLSDREWVCPKCNKKVLRDVNASLNIRDFGLLNYKKSGTERSKELVELPTLVGALKQEASPRLG